MATVTWPERLPDPTEASFAPVETTEVTKMASGRRRVRRFIPQPISLGQLTYTFTPEEYEFFNGWWKYTLSNGTNLVQFDETSAMMTEVGFRLIQYVPNTLSAPLDLAGKIQLSVQFYGLQEA